ncbi:heavy metal translocating P-type ATPase [Paenibacillus sp. GXUN7292]|uniref:heavy metal translocating P-type ATPase n=1 Tax=Paenibacillus sp. GXUN7292 TaxID=3422499 RepID=UPI003D7C3C4B
MNQYRIQGLSCAGCASRLEEEIKQLQHGDSATLSYNSGKLTVDPEVSMEDIKRILKKDGASIARSYPANSRQAAAHSGQHHTHSHSGSDGHEHSHEDGHAHEDGHSHDHGNQRFMLMKVIGGAILYAAALLLDGAVSPYIVIGTFIAAIVLSGYTTFIRGLIQLTKLKFNIDTLMTIALIGAACIGEWKEAALVAILFGLNELLEGYGMEKARRSMEALLDTAPSQATKLIDGNEYIVAISELQAGDTVIIKPGEKIPSDGTVLSGFSSVNEAAISGESMPVDKQADSHVFGGTINEDGQLIVQIDKAYEDSSLAKILHLVQEAQETKTPTELFINRFAKYYTPFILVVAVLVTVLPPLFFGGSWMDWLYQGLSVLIVGCPCALILSSPIAIVSGITRAARAGILIKGGVHLEQLGRIDTIAFDKTGTLTKGEPHVVEQESFDERFLMIAGAMEKSSSHPLAKAIMKHVDEQHIELPAMEELKAVAGKGLTGSLNGTPYWLGSESNITHLELPDSVQTQIDKWKANGLTIVLVASETAVLGMFGIADEIREESHSIIAQLRKLGIANTVMLTGDHEASASKVATEIGLTKWFSGLLPEDKVTKVKTLAGQGKVAMIGDGINDAPALATAQLGIAMGKGTDSAIETADIVLMQDHLGKLPEAISVAKRVNRIISFNISVSLGLKLIALLLTIPGWLTLWIAILSDMGATIFVTLVSLTILISRKERLRTS